MRLGRVSRSMVYLLLLCACFGSIMFLLSGMIRAVRAASPPHLSEISVLSSQDCPDAPPANAFSTATLIFCSPINQGYVGGSYGVHIVLIGENFPVAPLKWFYELQTPGQPNASLDSNEENACFHGRHGCPLSPLANPATKSIAQGTLFGWNWSTMNLFPQKIASYYLIAIGQSSQSFFSAISTSAFSVLSLQAPCVIALSENGKTPTDCSQPQQLSFTSSTSSQNITLRGSNWLLQGLNNENVGASVTITVLCDPGSEGSCSRTPLPPASTTADSNGQFTEQISLPANLVGAYIICVASHAMTVAPPITSPNNNDTVVNNALTYGCTKLGDAPELSFTMKQGLPPPPRPTVQPTPIPTPTPNLVLPGISQGLDIFTYLGLLLIVAAFVLFLLYHRTVIPDTPDGVSKISSPLIQDAMQRDTAMIAMRLSSSEAPQSVYYLTSEQWWSNAKQYVENESFASLPLWFTWNTRRKAKKILQLAQSGQFNTIQQIAEVSLVWDKDLWYRIRESFRKLPSSVIPEDTAELAFANLTWINVQDRNKLCSVCSEAIVLYEMLLSSIPPNSLLAADIAYNLGYAYSALSTYKPGTTNFLLDLALENYERALQIYTAMHMNQQHIFTLRCMGNANIAYSILSPDKGEFYSSIGNILFKQAEQLSRSI